MQACRDSRLCSAGAGSCPARWNRTALLPTLGASGTPQSDHDADHARYRTDEAGDGADQPGYGGDQRDLPTCRLRSNRLTRPRRGCGYDEANPGEQESNEEHEKTPSPDPTPATDCFGVRHTTTST